MAEILRRVLLEITRFKPEKDRLMITLKFIKAVLNDAELKQINNSAVNKLLDNLKDAVYEVEDLLDRVSTVSATRKTASNFCRFLNFQDSEMVFPNKKINDREMVTKLKDKVSRLEANVYDRDKQKDILGLKETARENLSWRSPSTSVEEGSNVYGRDKVKAAILKSLLDNDDNSDGKISVNAIVGMGGLGKTTLASLAHGYNNVSCKEIMSKQQGNSADCNNKYHVFLSFRGEDTPAGFQSHLWKQVQTRGVRDCHWKDWSQSSQLQDESTVALLDTERKHNIQTCVDQLNTKNIESFVVNETDLLKALNCDAKMRSQSQVQDKSNRYREPFSPDKRKKTQQRFSSFVTTAIVFLMLIYHIFILVDKYKAHGPVFPLLEEFGFMVFIWAIATMIVVGAPFSRLLRALLPFWAILLLLISAKSLPTLYLPISAIIFTGCYMLVEKQSPNEGYGMPT